MRNAQRGWMRTPHKGNAALRRAAGWAQAIGVLLLLASGCAEVRDELTIKKDGSGEVRIETRSHVPLNNLAMRQHVNMWGNSTDKSVFYPPFIEAELRAIFPGDGFTFRDLEEVKDDKGMTVGLRATVGFEDVNDLLDTPYAEARALELREADGRLRVRAATGLQKIAPFAASEKETISFMMPINKKPFLAKRDRFAYSFSVELPGAVEAEGAEVDGSRATWRIGGDAVKDDAGAAEALSRFFTASCPAGDVDFDPRDTLRLAAPSFDELEERKVARTQDEDLADRVREAARFIPVSLRMVRSFDLAGGQGFHGENELAFTGALILPRKLAPSRYGSFQVETATDDQGFSLVPDGRHHHQWDPYDHINRRLHESAEGPLTHIVYKELEIPGFDAETLTELKGSIELHYGGVEHLVKLPKAFPAAEIAEPESASSRSSSDEDNIAHPVLAELGMQFRVHHAQKQGQMIQLSGIVQGDGPVLESVQVYDGEGAPWPTMLSERGGGGDQRWIQIMVIGHPEGDLSLALRIQGGGGAIAAPVSLRDVKLYPEPGEDPEADPDKDDADARAPAAGAVPTEAVVVEEVR